MGSISRFVTLPGLEIGVSLADTSADADLAPPFHLEQRRLAGVNSGWTYHPVGTSHE